MFVQRVGGPIIERDAVAFCRILSERVHGDGMLATKVLFREETS